MYDVCMWCVYVYVCICVQADTYHCMCEAIRGQPRMSLLTFPLSQAGSLCYCLPCKSGCLTCQLSSVLLFLPASSLWTCWDYRHKLLCPALCEAENLNTGLHGCIASAPSPKPSSQTLWALHSESSLDYQFTKQNNIISAEWY